MIFGLILTGCTEEAQKKKTSISKEKSTETEIVEKKTPVKTEIKSIYIAYVETTLDNHKMASESKFESKSSSYFNGCHEFTLKKFQIRGSGKNLELMIISEDGKPLLQKDKFSLETSLDLSGNEVKKIEESLFLAAKISIHQNGKDVFTYSTTMSGCH